MNTPRSIPVLVTGATGYIGGRLVYRLLDAGYRVRALSRSFGKLQAHAWATHPNVELVHADLTDLDALTAAAQGCKAAYFLVHSTNQPSEDLAQTDRRAAANMIKAAEAAGLERIIYLGGLETECVNTSDYLKSRTEVAQVLMAGSVPITYLRAAMIIGSGSASFEMLRYLVGRMPVMITSRRIYTPLQPIAIRNVLVYLVECLGHPETIGQTYELVGPEVLTYLALIRIYAEEAGLRKRIVFPLSFMTPRLISYMVHLITPIPAYLARLLLQELECELVTKEHRIREIIPQQLLTAREAMHMALERIEQQVIKTSWMDAGFVVKPAWVRSYDVPFAGDGIYADWYRVTMKGTPDEVWEVIASIGGDNGWYFANWLWELRGWMDRIIGGPGTRRGRRQVSDIKIGDALDWWRVLDLTPGQRLLLLAEMKVPGEATLDFRLKQTPEGVTELTQVASFMPRGWAGMLYWYAVNPLHYYLFHGMLRAIATRAGLPIVSGPAAVTPLPRKNP